MPRSTLPLPPSLRRTLAAGLVALAGAGACAAPAAAQGCQGQAGTSAIEQYCEAIPRGDGGRDRPGSSGSGSGSGSGAAGSSSSSGSGSAGSGLSSSTAQALGAAGKDGAAVERLASGSSDSAGSQGKTKSSTPGGASSTDQGAVKAERVEGPADPSANPLKAATKAAGSGPVAGPGVVWGLVGLTAFGAIGAVLLRRRRGAIGPVDDTTGQE